MAQWQYHEELWVRGNDAAKEQVLAAIGTVRHTLMLFGGIVPRKASTHLRDLLTQCEATIASAVSAVTAVYSTETAMAKLALTEMAGKQSTAAVLGCQSAEQNQRFLQTLCRYPSFPPCR